MKTRITCTLTSLLLLTLASVVSFSQVKPQVVEIPFDFYRNEIILQVKINGKGPFNMMLDTGTDPSTIELNTARELGLKLIPLGSPPVGGGTAPRMVYGTGRDKKPWGINIGNVFLKDFVVTIDYRHKLVTLERP